MIIPIASTSHPFFIFSKKKFQRKFHLYLKFSKWLVAVDMSKMQIINFLKVLSRLRFYDSSFVKKSCNHIAAANLELSKWIVISKWINVRGRSGLHVRKLWYGNRLDGGSRGLLARVLACSSRRRGFDSR